MFSVGFFLFGFLRRLNVHGISVNKLLSTILIDSQGIKNSMRGNFIRYVRAKAAMDVVPVHS